MEALAVVMVLVVLWLVLRPLLHRAIERAVAASFRQDRTEGRFDGDGPR